MCSMVEFFFFRLPHPRSEGLAICYVADRVRGVGGPSHLTINQIHRVIRTNSEKVHLTMPSRPTSNYINFRILHSICQHIQPAITSNEPSYPACHYPHRATTSISMSTYPTRNHFQQTCEEVLPSPAFIIALLVIRLAP